MACNCITEMNEALATKNTVLVDVWQFGKPYTTVSIETKRIENLRDRKKATLAIPTFCPFCGTRYEEESQP